MRRFGACPGVSRETPSLGGRPRRGWRLSGPAHRHWQSAASRSIRTASSVRPWICLHIPTSTGIGSSICGPSLAPFPRRSQSNCRSTLAMKVILHRQRQDIAAYRRDEALELPTDLDYGCRRQLEQRNPAEAGDPPASDPRAGRPDFGRYTRRVGFASSLRSPPRRLTMSHIHAGRELFLEEMRDLRVDVSRETRDQLEALVYTLGRWQKAINLVGEDDAGRGLDAPYPQFGAAPPADPKRRQDAGRSRQRWRLSGPGPRRAATRSGRHP